MLKITLIFLILLTIFSSCESRCISCEEEARFNLKLNIDYNNIPETYKPDYMDMVLYHENGNRERFIVEESILLHVNEGNYNLLAISPEAEHININSIFSDINFDLPRMTRNDSSFVEEIPLVFYETENITVKGDYNEFTIFPQFQYIIDFKFNIEFENEVRDIEIYCSLSDILSKKSITNKVIEQTSCFLEFTPEIISDVFQRKTIHVLDFTKDIELKVLVCSSGSSKEMNIELGSLLHQNKINVCEIDILVSDDDVFIDEEMDISIVDWENEELDLGTIGK